MPPPEIWGDLGAFRGQAGGYKVCVWGGSSGCWVSPSPNLLLVTAPRGQPGAPAFNQRAGAVCLHFPPCHHPPCLLSSRGTAFWELSGCISLRSPLRTLPVHPKTPQQPTFSSPSHRVPTGGSLGTGGGFGVHAPVGLLTELQQGLKQRGGG